jgi:prepilin-type N-terminal cleavage/methylation domain-containing protein
LTYSRLNHCSKAFTLIELTVALCVVSVVMAAVATMAYAMGTANDVSDNTAAKQAQIRCATLRITEIVRNSRLIINRVGNVIAVWKNDDNNDGEINLSEIVYIGSEADNTDLGVCTFTSDARTLHPYQIGSIYDAWWSVYASSYSYTYLIPGCTNVSIVTDTAPPWTKSATITFNMQENGRAKTYQITATVRAWAGHMLDSTGSYLWPGDDELHPEENYPLFGSPIAF